MYTSPAKQRQIVFIDSAVEDDLYLATLVKPGIETIFLHPNRDAVVQISQVLAQRHDIDAVHLVSHGQPGRLQFGQGELNIDNLPEYQQFLEQWQNSFSDDAAILIYGCQVAATDIGIAFIKKISQLTGVNVAASNTVTGCAEKGGDWELQITTREPVKTSLAFQEEGLKKYSRILGTYTVNHLGDFDDGNIGNNTTTLREAINVANNNPGDDTINFNVTGDIVLTSLLPDITSNIVFNGPGANNLTIDGKNYYRIFSIDSGATVEIEGLTVANGWAETSLFGFNIPDHGGGIYNAGTLKVTNSTITKNTVIGRGGGIYNTGDLTVSGSILSDNEAKDTQSDGGGIHNEGGTVTVIDSYFSGNWAEDGGGAIRNNTNGTIEVNNSIFYNNFAKKGGAIHNRNGQNLLIKNSTLFNNNAENGGALYIQSESNISLIENSTIFGNKAISQGGGIEVTTSPHKLTIINSTITGNQADSDYNGYGIGGGIRSNQYPPKSLELKNTIIAGNFQGKHSVGAAGIFPDIYSINIVGNQNNLIGYTHNISGLNTDLSFASLGITSIDQVLDENLVPIPGSPVINTGDNSKVSENASIQGNIVDIGAVESPLDVVISEIMYDPSSNKADWEWIEVYNAANTPLDLTGFVLDDDDGNALTAANIAGGTIAPGETAILYNSAISENDFTNAWGPNINAVPVSNWSELENSGDRIGLWPSFASYQIGFSNVADELDYNHNSDWPVNNNSASIYLTDLTADNNDGNNWAIGIYGEPTPTYTAYESAKVGGNNGSDIGSPGATDSQKPTASLNIQNFTKSGANSHSITVKYQDNRAVDVSTLNDSDIIVTYPTGETLNATLDTITPNGNATSISATYKINAPGGTWDETDNGTYQVQLLANEVTDTTGNFADASDLGNFQVSINSNLPFFTSEAVDAATEDSAYTYNITTESSNGTNLTITAVNPLPNWLKFTDNGDGTATLTGTPKNNHVGRSLSLELKVTDEDNEFTTQTWKLAVVNVNDAPTVVNPIADQSATENSRFNFTVPQDTFEDIDANDVLTFTAQQSNPPLAPPSEGGDGSELPSWLSFDAESRQFSGIPTEQAIGNLDLQVIATDQAGARAIADFTLTIAANKNNDSDENNSGNDSNNGADNPDLTQIQEQFGLTDENIEALASGDLSELPPSLLEELADLDGFNIDDLLENPNLAREELLPLTDRISDSELLPEPVKDEDVTSISTNSDEKSNARTRKQTPQPIHLQPNSDRINALPPTVLPDENNDEDNNEPNNTIASEFNLCDELAEIDFSHMFLNRAIANRSDNFKRDRNLAMGTPDPDILNGGDGNDTMFGYASGDMIFGGVGSDLPAGNQAEQDLLFGNEGNDTLGGNEGADRIYGGQHDDLIFGGKDDDQLWGDRGNDTLIGDMGSDRIYGGFADPSFTAEDGSDLLLGGEGSDFLNGNQQDDTLCGGDGNDTVRGGKGDDMVCGHTGNDWLFGDRGNDTLGGGDGDDTLYGGTEFNHTGEGEDILFGGSGRDRFVLSANSGGDRILDFEIGEDLLVLAGGLTFDQLSITGLDDDSTKISTGNNQLIAILNGVDASAIGTAQMALF